MSPLEGVKVLDLSRLLPGPYASLLLADLGAQVDKVEEPIGGDYLRHMPPMVGDQSGMFLAINRNKRSICLDLKKAGGRDALLALVAGYDVLLEQFRPGVLDRLGLSHASLRERFPKLIICALTGYGQDGPLADRAGHDLNYLARAGILGMQGPVDGPPQVPGFQLADFSGGLFSVIGTLSALALRARTGEGSVVDISMLESAMGFGFASFGSMLAGGALARGNEGLTGGLAIYATYTTRDGKHVALGALEPKFASSFFAGIGLPFEMSALMPGAHQAALRAQIAAVFLTKTRDEWAAFGKEHDCCLEPVLEPHELAADAQMSARGMFFDLASPWGPLRQLRTPVTPRDAAHTPPPRQGEHTDAILREAGFDDAAIARLRSEGAAR